MGPLYIKKKKKINEIPQNVKLTKCAFIMLSFEKSDGKGNGGDRVTAMEVV
jgi:hypothetical protein